MSSSLRLARRRSTMTAVSAVVYPDSDKISIWTANGVNDLVVKRTGAVDYWDGETSRAKLRFGPLQAGDRTQLRGYRLDAELHQEAEVVARQEPRHALDDGRLGAVRL
jgi:hypothetical protein